MRTVAPAAADVAILSSWLASQYCRAGCQTACHLCLLHRRLDNGLSKLHKTQSEVDVLVENARAMALQVETKVANANVFAEQVRLSAPEPE